MMTSNGFPARAQRVMKGALSILFEDSARRVLRPTQQRPQAGRAAPSPANAGWVPLR